MRDPKYQTTKHRVRIRPRMRSIRAHIEAGYRDEIEHLQALASGHHGNILRLQEELAAERRITLRQHLARWWKEGPCPSRWRTFMSR